jgi:hypothetical protein
VTEWKESDAREVRRLAEECHTEIEKLREAGREAEVNAIQLTLHRYALRLLTETAVQEALAHDA